MKVGQEETDRGSVHPAAAAALRMDQNQSQNSVLPSALITGSWAGTLWLVLP